MTETRELLPENKKRIRPRRVRDYLSWLAALLIAGTLTYSVLTNPNYQWDVVAKYFTHESIIRGIGITLMLTAVSMIVGCVIGLALALMRDSKNRPVAAVAIGYISFFRGTPLLVQLIFWFNFAALYPDLSLGVPFTSWQYQLDTNTLIGPLTAAIIGLTLNEAAYMAEIIRGGFAAVDKGQIEAADSLGMSSSRKLRAVLLPQIMPAVIPPTGNQLIGMLKGTSLVSVLGVADLLQSTQLIYARTYETIPLLIVASLWYLAMTILLGIPQSMIERHYGRSDRVPAGARRAAAKQLEVPA
jgi:polar amino acid transport system permease protein